MTTDPLEDDGVLAPDELQLDDDRVDELGENRYLVRPEGSDSDAAVPPTARDGGTGESLSDDTAAAAGTDGTDDHPRTRHGLVAASEPHGVDITLKTDGEIAHHRATSHDVREVFVDLLTWYAGQLDDDMSPEEALQVMLAASDLEV